LNINIPFFFNSSILLCRASMCNCFQSIHGYITAHPSIILTTKNGPFLRISSLQLYFYLFPFQSPYMSLLHIKVLPLLTLHKPQDVSLLLHRTVPGTVQHAASNRYKRNYYPDSDLLSNGTM
jgi:hypothetical protein